MSEPLSSFASGRLKVIHARSDCHLACSLAITILALVAVLKFDSLAPGAGERFEDTKCKICFSARLPQSSGFICFCLICLLLLPSFVNINVIKFGNILRFEEEDLFYKECNTSIAIRGGYVNYQYTGWYLLGLDWCDYCFWCCYLKILWVWRWKSYLVTADNSTTVCQQQSLGQIRLNDWNFDTSWVSVNLQYMPVMPPIGLFFSRLNLTSSISDFLRAPISWQDRFNTPFWPLG